MPKQHSIRDQLEAGARNKHPQFARRYAMSRNPQLRRQSLIPRGRGLLITVALLTSSLAIWAGPARAEGGESFWGLEFHADGAAQRVVALDTEIQVEVTGMTARVNVGQSFRNTGGAWKEAVYRYPLPAGAAVDRMRLQAGSRVIEGEIREKSEARRQYQQAKSSGKLASLVEQQRPNQFETRLANIAPGEEIRVAISFLARVDYSGGTFSLSIPMAFAPRYRPAEPGVFADTAPLPMLISGPDPQGIDDHYLTVEVDLRAGLRLTSLESRYHDVDIHPTLDGYHVFLADPNARTDRDFELNWTPDFGAVPESTLSTWDAGDAVYALLMLAPPLPEAIAPRPREVVFIIDTSGSMQGRSLTQAKAALKQGLLYLGPDDRFNLIQFNTFSHLLFDESMPVYPGYLQEAEDYIDDLTANGGTEMAPALGMAMNLSPQPDLLRQIVFVTDGSVGNEMDLLLQIGEQLRDSRLFTVSIGSAPNTGFMRKAAEIGRGSHTRIGRLEDVEERMSTLWARIENPAIQNVCVDWGMDAEFYPELIPDLYAGEPLWVYARLPRQPSEVTVCGELDGRDWEMNSRLIPGTGGSNLATLWARSRIEALEDSRVFGSDPAMIREQVLGLALEFGLLTPYTSLVAVDRTPRRPADDGLESEHIPGLLPAGSGLSAGFSQTATGWAARLMFAFLSLLVATGMLLYAPPSPKKVRTARGARSPMNASTA